jgi:hypothetical protein
MFPTYICEVVLRHRAPLLLLYISIIIFTTLLLLLVQDQFNCKCYDLQGKVAETVDDLMDGVQWLQETLGPAMLEIKICPGSRKDLGRPTRSPIQNKVDFMNFVSLNAHE